MTHSRANTRCDSANCERAHEDKDRTQLPGTTWRSALAGLVAAPMRLHRYRNFHAEVVEDALRAFDCRTCQ